MRAGAERRGIEVDEEAARGRYAEAVEEQIESESDAFFATGELWDDGIIDPRDTRTVLGIALSALPIGDRSRAPAASASSGCRAMADASISKVLVANRGEIAGASSPAAAAWGCATVAVYADPDAGARLRARGRRGGARSAGTTAAESYLDIDAAPRRGAADRARTRSIPATASWPRTRTSPARAATPGSTWIGPTADAIEAMGSKIRGPAPDARRPASRSCPAPSWRRRRRRLAAAGRAVGFPLLVKASAGGGGKGMRLVAEPATSWPAP